MSIKDRISKYTNAFNFILIANQARGQNFPEVKDPQTQQVIQRGVDILPPIQVQGNRTVRNIKLKITANGNDDQIIGAILYVPENSIADSLQTPQIVYQLTDNYNRILSSFIIPANAMRNQDGTLSLRSAPQTIETSFIGSIDLHSGDKIAVVFTTWNGLFAGDGTIPDYLPITISGIAEFSINF